jgi:UDP-N-acetylenolpyruvoylglucosamine reductase
VKACLFDYQQSEIERFRQVVVNVVLATDIFDKELNDLRKNRWKKAFSGEITDNSNGLKATIVIEHIIQASDVAHTMQHWHIYRRWNRQLLEEMYAAHRAGRMDADPTDFWYKGELSFFDNYVIPLAKKLKDCNVFGVSSDECLVYAEQNRAEWEVRGEEIVWTQVITGRVHRYLKTQERGRPSEFEVKASVLSLHN